MRRFLIASLSGGLGAFVVVRLFGAAAGLKGPQGPAGPKGDKGDTATLPPAPGATRLTKQTLAFAVVAGILGLAYSEVLGPLPTLLVYGLAIVGVFAAWLARDVTWDHATLAVFGIGLLAALVLAWNTAQENEQDERRFDQLCTSLVTERYGRYGNEALSRQRSELVCGFVPNDR